MKTKCILSVATATVLATFLTVLSGCDQAITTGGSSFAGTGTYIYPVHATEVIAEATVSTDSNGVVTAADWNEYQGPSSWVYSTGTSGAVAGGEIIRMKMAGKNAGSTIVDQDGNKAVEGYTFFYYNLATLGWVEYTPTYSSTWTAPTSSASTADNFELKMANPLYAQAYVDDCKAVTASASNTDLTTVSFAISGTNLVATVSPVVGSTTVGNAAAQAALRSIKALNKNSTASAYFPISSTNLGYKTNHDRIVAFFTKNPKATYTTAATTTLTWADYNFSSPSSTYTQLTDAVWTLGSGTDAVTGATCSDFPSYSLGLQTAYLYALADNKGGNTRSVQ
jgi:hypothetical protein